ncbi:tetratricopeptide repeat protein [Pseudodesulfovibrio sediminis]|nr:tetratricopeptide repeat protein [Pseudodesulfovibrio sediminis]
MTEQTRSKLQKAYSCIKNNQPECARTILSRYMENSTRPHPFGILLYGSLLMEQNQLQEAAQILERGYADFPQCRQIVHNLAVVRYEQKEFTKAGELFLKSCLLTKKPAHNTRYQAATCFFQAKKYAQAYDVTKPLLGLKTVKPDWVRLAAHSLILLKRWPEAERTLIHFLRRSPTEHAYWKLLANIRMQRKHYKKAAAALEIAYRIAQPTALERRTLSQLYLYINAPLLAAHALEGSFTHTPSPKVCDQLAQAYLTAGRTKQALDMLDKAMALEKTPERSLIKGRILYAKRRYPEAIAALRQAVQLNDKTGLANYLLGMIFWEQKQWDEARHWFQSAEKFKHHARHATRAINAINAMEESSRQSNLPFDAS